MHRRSFLALLASPVLEALTPEKTREIEKLVSAEMARQSIPGLSIGTRSGDDLWLAGYGLSDLENFVPAKAVTVYRTASIAKPMLATAVMQLVEAGKLDLDAPVEKYVPGFPQKPWPVTTRLLLAHTGGIRTYHNGEEFSVTHYTSAQDAVRQFAADDLAYEPGTRYLYTSLGYVLAGAVIEGITGEHFSDYMKAHLFEPAGMRETYLDDVYELIPNRSRGYQCTDGGRILNAQLVDTSNRAPGGGLASTTGDILRFLFALPRLVRPESLGVMWKEQTTRDGKGTGYGLGWGVGEWKDKTRVSHTGGQAGVSTLFWFFPVERTAVVAMANLQGVAWDPLFEGAAQALL
jgi:serine beta-lactamase-like protein LACTB, mitochondrial